MVLRHLKPGDIVILDNSRTHEMELLESMVHAVGAKIRPLPRYSPDFNPIEYAFGHVKKWLEANGAVVEAHGAEVALDMAFAECGSCAVETIHHCGYGLLRL